MLRSSAPENNKQRAGSAIPSRAPRPWTFVAVAICFALSGFAALLYQTAWARQFSVVFGTSEVAVAIVLAAYMAGLALGARAVERYLDRVHRPVLVYGLLEFGIGIAAVAVPFLLLAAERIMVATIGGQPEPPGSEGWAQTLFYVVTAFVVLIIPTALMGATLPLLTRHAVRTPEQIGSRTGLLYAVNTFGAVGGALATAYWLLPGLGLSRTVFVGAAVNVLVLGIAALIARVSDPARAPAHLPDAVEPRASTSAAPLRVGGWKTHSYWILPLMLLSGAVSFLYEVLWARMLSYILGGSIFAFANMVASFLLGIALGSLVASQLARSRRHAVLGFVIAQVAIAACSSAIYLGFDALMPERAGLVGNSLVAIVVLLPATFFIGATFPFAVRILTDEPAAAAAAAARVYAWNTVGAIAGALLAGFVIIPELRFEGSIYVAVLANMTLAVLACGVVARAYLWSGAAVAAAVALGVFFRPEPPHTLLRTSPLNVNTAGPMRFYEVGRSASVVVLEQDGAFMLRTNGLPEALIETPGIAPKFSGEFWLSPLAVLARPRTQSMLVIGYGGGVVLDAVPPSVRSVDVVELEPKVIDANRALAPLRKRDPLLDPRVQIILNDARSALTLTDKRYDAIVSQPSHPWTAGASHLYTREFMRLARNHLADDGVFVQWMNIGFLDESLLRSLAATLLDVFGQVRVYRPDPNTLIFLASGAALDVEQIVTRNDTPLDLSPGHYARFGIHCPEDVVVALTLDQRGVEALARGAPLITDDHNRLATDDVYDRGRGLTPVKLSGILDAHDPLQRQGSWIYSEFGSRLAFDYMARRMSLFVVVDRGLPRRIRRMAALLPDPSTSAYVQAIARASVGDRAGAERLVRRSREARSRQPGGAFRHAASVARQARARTGRPPKWSPRPPNYRARRLRSWKRAGMPWRTNG